MTLRRSLMVALLCASSSAGAQAAPDPRAATWTLGVEAHAGYGLGVVDGVLFGGAVFARRRWLELGAFYTGSVSKVFSFSTYDVATMHSLSLGAGVHRATSSRASRGRLHAVLTGGAHVYGNVGAEASGGLYAETRYASGVSGVTPFVGLRAGAAWEWGATVRFTLGLAALVELDLTRPSVTQKTWPGGWSSGGWTSTGEPSSEQQRYSLGGVVAGAAVTVGMTFDP